MTVTDDNNCEYEVDVEVDYANEDPVIPLDSTAKLCEGFEITLDAGTDGKDYLWSTGATTQTVQADSGGNYSVTVTNGAGCDNDATVLVVEELCVGVEELSSVNIWSVYPNPTTDLLNIENLDQSVESASVDIVSVEGRTVLTKQTRNSLTTLDLSNLDRGVYMLRISSDGEVMTHRVVLQ